MRSTAEESKAVRRVRLGAMGRAVMAVIGWSRVNRRVTVDVAGSAVIGRGAIAWVKALIRTAPARARVIRHVGDAVVGLVDDLGGNGRIRGDHGSDRSDGSVLCEARAAACRKQSGHHE